MRREIANIESGQQIGHLSPRAGRGRIALAIRLRGSLRERGGDGFENSRHVAQHIVVPETQDTEIVIDEPFVVNRIARVVGVLTSVYLDNEAAFTAGEVDCVGTSRILSDEFVTVHPGRPQPIPQRTLRIGCRLPQTSGSLGLHPVRRAHAATPLTRQASDDASHRRATRRPLPARGERLTSRVSR